MDNPVALATLGKQNTKQNKTQQMKLEKKGSATWTWPKTGCVIEHDIGSHSFQIFDKAKYIYDTNCLKELVIQFSLST